MAEIVGDRIPYHSDGTAVRIRRTDTTNGYGYPDVGWSEAPMNAVAGMNSLTGASMFVDIYTWATAPGEMQMLFPVPTDLTGIFAAFTTGGIRIASPVGPYVPRQVPVLLEYSYDSLAGDDGTWHTWGVLPPSFVGTHTLDSLRPFHRVHGLPVNRRSFTKEVVEETYRVDVESWTLTEPDYRVISKHVYESFSNGGGKTLNLKAVRALKLTAQTPLATPPGYNAFSEFNHNINVFLYGGPADTWTEYLQVEDASERGSLKHEADWGTVPYHSSADRKVRVRNRSRTRSAERIVVSTEPYDNLPMPYRGMFLLSLDGVHWEEELTLYTMGPDSVSPTIYVRRVTGIEFPEGPGQVLLSARVGRWV